MKGSRAGGEDEEEITPENGAKEYDRSNERAELRRVKNRLFWFSFATK